MFWSISRSKSFNSFSSNLPIHFQVSILTGCKSGFFILQIAWDSGSNQVVKIWIYEPNCLFISLYLTAPASFTPVPLLLTGSINSINLWSQSTIYRSSRLQMLFKIGILKIFANFTGKHLLFVKAATWDPGPSGGTLKWNPKVGP